MAHAVYGLSCFWGMAAVPGGDNAIAYRCREALAGVRNGIVQVQDGIVGVRCDCVPVRNDIGRGAERHRTGADRHWSGCGMASYRCRTASSGYDAIAHRCTMAFPRVGEGDRPAGDDCS